MLIGIQLQYTKSNYVFTSLSCTKLNQNLDYPPLTDITELFLAEKVVVEPLVTLGFKSTNSKIIFSVNQSNPFLLAIS